MIRSPRPITFLACLLAAAGAAFSASPPTPATPPTTAPSAKPTLWIIGDSTVNNTANGGLGWGAPIAKLFDPARINVQNKARGGRSARSFTSEGLWDAVAAQIKPGDFVLMQFGHNDGGNPKSPNSKGRPDLPGLGEEATQAISSAGKDEVVHTYGWYMRHFVQEAKAKGATPIMLTMVPFNRWSEDGKIKRPNDTFIAWCQAIAQEQKIPFINLNDISARRFEEEGEAATGNKYFNINKPDFTHTSPAGAQLNAESVIMGIRALPELPLNQYLSDAGKKLPPADPTDVLAPPK